MVKKLIGLTIAVLLLFSLAACNPPEEDDMGLKVGFEWNTDGKPTPDIFCAYTLEKSYAQVGNDVEMQFFYGLTGDFGDLGEVNVSAKITICNKSESEILLKTVENFTTDNYKCNMKSDDWLAGFSIEFSHSEKIIIPAELFIEKSGYMAFKIRADVTLLQSGNLIGTNESHSISLWYKIVDGKIILSTTEL